MTNNIEVKTHKYENQAEDMMYFFLKKLFLMQTHCNDQI
jgi:hypothetical protein